MVQGISYPSSAVLVLLYSAVSVAVSVAVAVALLCYNLYLVVTKQF